MAETPGTDEESVAATRPRREIKPTKKVIEMEERMDTPFSSSLSSGGPRSAQSHVPQYPHTPKSKAPSAQSGRASIASHRTARPSQSGHNAPFVTAREYPIYFWPHPRPTDFTALHDSQREWKRRADVWDEEHDILDGAEDWYIFDDTADQRVIASNFVIRAKRAFRKGGSWDDYVAEEMKAYNEVEARKLSRVFLSNDLRIKVWDSLKHRLCEEIWSEAYRDPPGLVKLRVGDARERESLEHDPYASNPPGAQPRSTAKRRRLDPRPDDFAKGIVGHTLDPDGFAQPFYAGEEEAPHGIAKDMAEVRRAQAWEAKQERFFERVRALVIELEENDGRGLGS